jgi:hypothetical protein
MAAMAACNKGENKQELFRFFMKPGFNIKAKDSDPFF